MYSLNFVVCVTLFVLCSATDDADHTPTYADLHNKYCDLQAKNCNHTLHPLCATFNPVHYPVEQYNFYALAQDDIDFILTTLNTFRNGLAAGNIAGQKSGANLRVVKWSDEYARLLKAKLLYTSVCTEISFTGQITLQMEEFTNADIVGDTDQYFYRRMFLERVVNDSTSNSPWIDILRAEFDRIGCVYYEEDEYELKTVACYITRYGPRDVTTRMDTLYQYGVPCSNCSEGDCSEIWTNLCDESVERPQTVWNYNKIMMYAIVCGCAMLVIIVTMLIVVKRRNNKFEVKLEMKEQRVLST